MHFFFKNMSLYNTGLPWRIWNLSPLISPPFNCCSHLELNPVLSLYLKGNAHCSIRIPWDKLRKNCCARPCEEENCKPFLSTCTQCSNNRKPAGVWGEEAAETFSQKYPFYPFTMIWTGALDIFHHRKYMKANMFSVPPVCVGVCGIVWVGKVKLKLKTVELYSWWHKQIKQATLSIYTQTRTWVGRHWHQFCSDVILLLSASLCRTHGEGMITAELVLSRNTLFWLADRLLIEDTSTEWMF